MRVLIACEYSAVVRTEFEKRGWDAWSCDYLDTEIPGQHYKGDVFDIIDNSFDLMIGHPPCTYLAVSANRHILGNPERWWKQFNALEFVYRLMNANIDHICIENPISVISTYIRKPDQIINPYYFGDNVPKKTCLWLKNLPLLHYSFEDNLFFKKTSVQPEYVEYHSSKNKNGISKYSVFGKLGKGHGHERSKTFPGIANAMADQWTEYFLNKPAPGGPR